MSEVTYTSAEEREKTRLNLSVAAGIRKKLIALSGGERSVGTFLGQMVDRLEAGHAALESAVLDLASIRQILDGSGVLHDEALPSVAKKRKGDGGQIRFGLILWRDGRPEGLKFPYDAQMGWASSGVQASIVSQALGQLAGAGWQVVGQHGDLLILSRPRALVPAGAPSLN